MTVNTEFQTKGALTLKASAPTFSRCRETEINHLTAKLITNNARTKTPESSLSQTIQYPDTKRHSAYP